MNLPPRIKTLYPNTQNIAYDVETPIPIESAFFLEDAEKDPTKSNRYYFNFPGNWITSNNGETIIGVRKIWMMKKVRKLKFSLSMAKLLKTDKDEHAKGIDPSNGNLIYEKCKKYIKQCTLPMIFTYLPNQDIHDFFKVLHETFKEQIKAQKLTGFEQSDYTSHNRDLQVDAIYDKNEYRIKIFSERNDNYEKPYDTYMEPYLVMFRFNDMNEDFKEVFNIGTKPHQNNPFQYNQWKFDHNFRNVWDRKPCKIYSSIAEQSSHQYIGNSEVDYSPIKYFKLRSTDQRFWIDLYSSNHHNLPVSLPENESFCIEMQFLPYNKMIDI